ncbi:MAG: hypothetical protein AABX13_06310 [Nanoarchaeota archaeon]
MRKRGQSAAGAAVFLAIVMALLIGFILFIPPKERAELLGEQNLSKVVKLPGAKVAEEVETLLSVSPGRIDFLGQKEVEHPLPVVTIYTKTESKVLAEKNMASARRGVFSEEQSKFSFSLPDLENTEKVLLSFSVRQAKGRLKISLNDEEIFNAEVDSFAKPIPLPKNMLHEDNELLIRISSPGIAFWATNEVQLENLKVVGDVTALDAQTSKVIFLVSETEKRNLEEVRFKFQPECIITQVGKLRLSLNGQEIYQTIPDCDLVIVPIELSPSLIQAGENELVFHTERGTYLISHSVIKSKLKELEFPTYYFKLTKEQVDDVKDEKKRVRMQVEFVDVSTAKFGDFVFNGDLIPFDTKEASLVIDLSADVVVGNNAVKIKPQKTVEIRALTVELVEE